MIMPKHTRSASQNHGRYANAMPVSLAPSAPMVYSRRASSMAMAPTYYPTVPSSAPQLQPQQYEPYPAVTVAPTMPHRPSSGAWSPQDDQSLLQARQQGLNWAQIQSNYFPNKTPNACRKRHERLMERKGADDWDARRMEHLAREYTALRTEIWKPLADRTGQKWQTVEAKCFSQGLKNLQNAARSASRRERLEAGQSVEYDDDSGISGIGLTPVDDLDPSYSSPDSRISSSPQVVTNGNPNVANVATSFNSMQSMQMNGYGHSSYNTSSGYNSSASPPGYGAAVGHPGDTSYLTHGQRLPSVENMGIGAIIHRSSHGGPSTSM